VHEEQPFSRSITPRAATAAPSRRHFLRLALLGGLGVAALGAVAGVVDFLFPRAEWAALRRSPAGHVDDYPRGSDPVRFADGRGVRSLARGRWWSGGYFLVRLDRGQVDSGGQDGFVALADYCTHLGCAVPWRSDFRFDERQGWFRCPCHGATFTRAGARVFGPAPRGMDYFPVEIDEHGNLYVDRTEVQPAVGSQPAQATPWPRTATS
jgi:cytochrome b6-f complex iron-sulfur subunit